MEFVDTPILTVNTIQKNSLSDVIKAGVLVAKMAAKKKTTPELETNTNATDIDQEGE